MTMTGRAWRRATAATDTGAATSVASMATSSAIGLSCGRSRRGSAPYWWMATSRNAACSEPRLRARVLGVISRDDKLDTAGACMGML